MRSAVTPPFSPPEDRRLLGMGMRLLAMAFLSSMLALVKLAGDAGISLIEIIFWRQAFALPIILIWVILGPGLASLKTKRPGAHARRSILGLTGMVFNFGSVMLLPLAEATAIGFMMPIFATLLSIVLLHERVGLHRWSAILMGFIGVVIVIQPGGVHIPLKGALFGLVAAALIALVSIQIRDLSKTENGTTTAFWFSTLTSLPFAFALPWFATPHDATQWLLLAGLGTIGGIGQIMLSASLRFAPVSTVIGMDYSSLIWTTLIGWMLWQHLPSTSTWFGAPLIIASGLYIAWREHKLALQRSRDVSA